MKEKYIEKICATCGGSGWCQEVNGEWVRERRLADNMTLRQMARELKISAAYLSDIELGKRAVPLSVTAYIERNNL